VFKNGAHRFRAVMLRFKLRGKGTSTLAHWKRYVTGHAREEDRGSEPYSLSIELEVSMVSCVSSSRDSVWVMNCKPSSDTREGSVVPLNISSDCQLEASASAGPKSVVL
jgi:hypothetical protein